MKRSEASSTRQTWLIALVIGALAASGAVGTSRVCRSRCSPTIESLTRSPGDWDAPRTWTVAGVRPIEAADRPNTTTALAERTAGRDQSTEASPQP